MCQKEGTSPLVAIKIGVVLTQIRFLRGKIHNKPKAHKFLTDKKDLSHDLCIFIFCLVQIQKMEPIDSMFCLNPTKIHSHLFIEVLRIWMSMTTRTGQMRNTYFQERHLFFFPVFNLSRLPLLCNPLYNIHHHLSHKDLQEGRTLP